MFHFHRIVARLDEKEAVDGDDVKFCGGGCWGMGSFSRSPSSQNEM